MRNASAVLSLVVYLGHPFAGDEADAVRVVSGAGHNKLITRVRHVDHRLEQLAFALLDILSHGMEVCCKCHRCREDALALLALTLAVELFPPLGKENQRWFVAYKDLCRIPN